MGTATLQKPKPTHREITPIRECRSCGAYLRTGNESRYCDPCTTPESELDEAEVFARIAKMPDPRQRRAAFEAYTEMAERKAA